MPYSKQKPGTQSIRRRLKVLFYAARLLFIFCSSQGTWLLFINLYQIKFKWMVSSKEHKQHENENEYQLADQIATLFKTNKCIHCTLRVSNHGDRFFRRKHLRCTPKLLVIHLAKLMLFGVSLTQISQNTTVEQFSMI